MDADIGVWPSTHLNQYNELLQKLCREGYSEDVVKKVLKDTANEQDARSALVHCYHYHNLEKIGSQNTGNVPTADQPQRLDENVLAPSNNLSTDHSGTASMEEDISTAENNASENTPSASVGYPPARSVFANASSGLANDTRARQDALDGFCCHYVLDGSNLYNIVCSTQDVWDGKAIHEPHDSFKVFINAVAAVYSEGQTLRLSLQEQDFHASIVARMLENFRNQFHAHHPSNGIAKHNPNGCMLIGIGKDGWNKFQFCDFVMPSKRLPMEKPNGRLEILKDHFLCELKVTNPGQRPNMDIVPNGQRGAYLEALQKHLTESVIFCICQCQEDISSDRRAIVAVHWYFLFNDKRAAESWRTEADEIFSAENTSITNLSLLR